MIESISVFGAFAIVYLKSDLSLENFAGFISKILLLPDFVADTDIDPPHDIQYFCETLGFDISLNKSQDFPGFNFLIKMETELTLKESYNGQVYNLSPWLARYISIIGKIETFPAPSSP